MRLVPEAREAVDDGSPAERAGRAFARHCERLIETAGEACVAVKLQLACFERLGAPGWQALADTVRLAHQAGLLVIADGKRGDVPHTASAYGQALTGTTETPWGTVHGLGADAVTASPLLGSDALEPIVAAARAAGAGTFVLVRTSNPGAAEVQEKGDGAPLYLRLAGFVDELGREGIGDCGLSDVGAVVAATRPELIETLREQMPRAVFLLPGVGAQGGRVEEIRPAFGPGRAAALVAASRSIVDPAIESGDTATARAAAEQLRAAAWELSSQA
jgi:orotidine-5'-phosphate decarboxylase